MKPTSILLRLLLTAFTVAYLNACGQSAPTFKTPDELLQAFNENVGKEYVDVEAIVILIHPENARQQQMLDAVESMLPFLQLDAAMRAEFNTSFEENSLQSLYGQLADPARIIEQSEGRVVAQFIDWRLKPRKLHLVQLNGQWKISGLTLEEHPQISQDFDEGRLTLSINNREAFARVAPEMVRRIRAAEFPYQLAARRVTHELAGVHFEPPASGRPRNASNR